MRRFLRQGEVRLGLLLLVVVLALIVVGPALAPYSPKQVATGPMGAPPSSAHLLGTDALGRDVLSRMLHGGAQLLVIPLIAVAVAFSIGGILGIVAGYLGGVVDAVLCRVADILLTLPGLMLILVVMASFGTGVVVVIVALGLVYAPGTFRIMRGATQGVRTREYLLAARARGESVRWTVLREIVPNIAPTLLVDAAVRAAWAITLFATLSFLGLGAQPPSSNWGLMVAENRDLLFTSPVACIAPAVAVAAIALSFNFLADGITAWLGHDRLQEIQV